MFREAAVEHYYNRSSPILIATPIGSKYAAAGSLLFVAAILAVAYFGHFTRTVSASGVLIPVGGPKRIFAPITGIVAHKFVRLNDTVARA